MNDLDGKTRLLTMPRLLELLREERAKAERLEKALDRALHLCLEAQADLSDNFPNAAQRTLVKLAEAARAALKERSHTEITE